MSPLVENLTPTTAICVADEMPHAAFAVKLTDESPSLTPNRTSSDFVILQANRLYSVDPGTVMLPESTHPLHSSLGPDSLRDTESYAAIQTE